MMNNLAAFIEVDEDWYGNFKIADDARYNDIMFIRVSVISMFDGTAKVHISGNDDYAMEKYFLDFEEAKREYSKIVAWQKPTICDLRIDGYTAA